MVIAAIERAGIPDPAAIRDELAATRNYLGVVGLYGGFDAGGDVIPPWGWLERYQNGRWVRLQPLSDDTDGDCDVDTADIMAVASRWRARVGDARYDPSYDLDRDGDIDIVDIMRVAGHWGESCTIPPGPSWAGSRI